MTIDVYWARIDAAGPAFNQNFKLAISKPKPLLQSFSKDFAKSNYLRCPAFRSSAKNTYVLSAHYNYRIEYDLNNMKLTSSMYDENFFHSVVSTSDIKDHIIMLPCPYIFFSEKPLIMEQQHPYAHSEKSIGTNVNVLHGEFDISKWFRGLSCGFIPKEKKGEAHHSVGDVLSYVKFKTEEKINFKEFNMTDQIDEYGRWCLNHKTAGLYKATSSKPEMIINPPAPFSKIYSIFKENQMKKRILKEIKNNLID